MINFLLVLSGGLVLTEEDTTPAQRTVAGVLMGVGLARALDDVLGRLNN